MISDDTKSPNEALPNTAPTSPKYGERGGYGVGTYGAAKEKIPSTTPVSEGEAQS